MKKLYSKESLIEDIELDYDEIGVFMRCQYNAILCHGKKSGDWYWLSLPAKRRVGNAGRNEHEAYVRAAMLLDLIGPED